MPKVENFIREQEVIDLLKKLIRINTVGQNETLCAKAIISLLDEEGIDSYQSLESEAGRGNLIIDFGSGKKTLIMTSHLDTVPAGDGWKYDPFSGIQVGKYIYGRGAVDSKGQVVTLVYLVILLHRMNLNLDGKIRLLLVADEEQQNQKHGMRFLLREHKELFQNVFGGIGELGGLINFKGEERQLLIYGEKGTVGIELQIMCEAGHSSVINTYKFVEYTLKQINRIPRCFGETPEFIQEMLNKYMGIPWFIIKNKFMQKIFLRRGKEGLNSLLYNIVSPTVVTIGDAVNMAPSKAKIILNVRYHENIKITEILDLIYKSLDRKYKTNMKVLQYTRPNHSPTRTKLFNLIDETIREMGYKSLPIIMPASSDSSWLRREGIPMYHFFMTKEDLSKYPHNINERISIDDLMLAIKGYYTLIRKLFPIKNS